MAFSRVESAALNGGGGTNIGNERTDRRLRVAVVSKSGNPCGESSDWQESLLRWAGSRCHGRLLACHRSGFVTSSPLSELAQRAVLLLSFAT